MNRVGRLFALIHPRLAVVLHDLFMVWLAWVGSNRLRISMAPDIREVPWFSSEVLIVLVAQGLVLWWTGLYRGLWRFASLPDLWNIARAAVVGSLAISLGLFLFSRLDGVPRSVLVLYPIALILLLGLPRMAYRFWKDSRHGDGGNVPALRVLVIGAGHAGEALVRDLKRESRYRFVGFIDDSRVLRGARLHGIPVLGTIERIPELAREVAAEKD